MPDRMTDEQLNTLRVRTLNKQFGDETQREVAITVLDELKAARAEQLIEGNTAFNLIQGLSKERDTLRAERDAARAQAFEEAAEMVEGWGNPYSDEGFMYIVAAELRRRADAPDGSRTATLEVKNESS